jgi:hypothetical protein
LKENSNRFQVIFLVSDIVSIFYWYMFSLCSDVKILVVVCCRSCNNGKPRERDLVSKP